MLPPGIFFCILKKKCKMEKGPFFFTLKQSFTFDKNPTIFHKKISKYFGILSKIKLFFRVKKNGLFSIFTVFLTKST